MRPIRVLVVDDSMMMRNMIVQGLNADPNIEVVAQAQDAYEARDAIIKYKPDVMTLDVEMPRMSGIDFLKKLMPQYPFPVVMLSALNDKVFDALDAGAVDFVKKPDSMNKAQLNDFLTQELATKVKIASTAKVGKLKRVDTSTITDHIVGGKDRVVAIGASTGGTEAIFEVVKRFKRDIPGVVIVQHMPPGFTKMYADRLNNQCEVAVKEAATGDRVLPGQVLIAPGDRHMRLLKVNGEYQVECKGTDRVNGHCPSVEVLFESVAKVAGKNAVGVILTGMGGDGGKGLLSMRNAGAQTIGQDEATCVVYGMPKVAFDLGAVQIQKPVTAIAGEVYRLLSK
ncbi:MAG: chemotaxis response regulator protein-glutamate methylesterase [Butyrivibrio sp.]|nr:chemotaxis response regulator protein-glutamate methylesterase [Acetatifactor muris]MCM1559140.1 chemotaxis response regulator protein-glutamate methylesterase [Butyrivibrio sp.]